jgi:hypothetical protein
VATLPAVKTAEPRALLIAFGDQEVLVRSDEAEVMGALERIFAMMRAPASHRIVGELEVYREDGRYVVRGHADATHKNGSMEEVVRRVRYSAIQFLIDARPDLVWFHAAAAVFRGRAVVFPGPRGGGKSTLVASLCARGWGYLSDDVVPLDPGSNTVLPFPQAPAVRKHPGREMPPEWLRMLNKTDLRLQPNNLCGEPTPVGAVVRLSYRREARAELSVSSPATTALHLLEQCWNFPRRREAAVGHICALAQRVPGFSVSFSDGEAAADIVARELEGQL